jgi:hypothetical protein
VSFTGAINNVPANDCVTRLVSGIDVQPTDHLLLTPSFDDAEGNLDYTAEQAAGFGTGSMIIKVCNPTTGAIDDGNTHFTLLVIDAE